MNKLKIIFVLVFLVSMGVMEGAVAGSGDKEVKQEMQTYVIIVGGLNKDVEQRQSKDKAVIRLRKFVLGQMQVESEQVKVLAEPASLAVGYGEISSAENLKKALSRAAERIEEQDRFIFYYVGQGNIASSRLRFNLPGPDVTHDELCRWLSKVETSSKLIVLDCPGAGQAVKHLSGPNTIVVCGSRSDQEYSTRFSDFFIPSLSHPDSDTDDDGRTSLLEAFTFTSRELDELYRREDLLKTETAILEDDGDGVASQRPWRYATSGKDGLGASKYFFVKE